MSQSHAITAEEAAARAMPHRTHHSPTSPRFAPPPPSARWVAIVLCAFFASPLIIALWLSADAQGHSTHTQLGLPACGMLETMNIPCMTCGMTTSFTHAVHGNLIQSFITQPAGAMLALLCAAMTIVAGYAAVFNLSLNPLGRRVWTPRVVIVGLAILLAAWGYKALSVQGLLS